MRNERTARVDRILLAMLAIIGGTGFSGLTASDGEMETTAFGDVYMETGELDGTSVVFVPRHGNPPRYPPHKINYRAIIQALFDARVDGIIAVNAVGSVDETLSVPALVIPDQIIDYTWGRQHTFHDDQIVHVDLTHPYDPVLRTLLCDAAVEYPARHDGVYGCTQGPRLETAAEIRRLRKDGCHIVGMTAMPEAGLARERGIPYAGICVVVNAGAGIADRIIDMDEIRRSLETGMGWVRNVLIRVIHST